MCRGCWPSAWPGSTRRTKLPKTDLAGLLEAHPSPSEVPVAIRDIIDCGLDDVPLPGSGFTAERFEILSQIGRHDLALARLLEGHLDALAILAEAGCKAPAADSDGSKPRLGVWAAGPPESLVAETAGSCNLTLRGRKRWCSGASFLTHALITASSEAGDQLFCVNLSTSGIRPVEGSWPAVGMARTDTLDVSFDDVLVSRDSLVGGVGWYGARAGFWMGSAGVAAVWLGGAEGVAAALDDSRRRDDPHFEAHRGAVAARLWILRTAMGRVAELIDSDPDDTAQRAKATALAFRHSVEIGATEVISRVGRALGAGPLGHDPAHAARVADLSVYVRQDHAERDVAELSHALAGIGDLP